MTARPGWPAVSGAATFDDIRRASAGDFIRNTSGTLRAGVVPHSTAALITGKGSMAVDVALFYAIIDRSGAVRVPNDGTVSVTISNAPTSGSRWSVIYIRQREADKGDGADGPVIDKVEATSLAGARALLPAGAMELGHVQVPAGAATTNASGVVITETVPLTTLAGGTVPFRNQTEQNAAALLPGTRAWRLDTNIEMVRHVEGWDPARPGGSYLGFASSGYMVFPHGLKRTPNWVNLAPRTGIGEGADDFGARVFRPTLWQITATNIEVRYVRHDSNAWVTDARFPASGNGLRVDWTAGW